MFDCIKDVFIVWGLFLALPDSNIWDGVVCDILLHGSLTLWGAGSWNGCCSGTVALCALVQVLKCFCRAWGPAPHRVSSGAEILHTGRDFPVPGDSLPWWEIVCGSELLLTCRIPAVGSDTVPLHLSCFSLQAISIWHKMAGIYWVWNKISLTWGYVRTFFKCGLVLALYPVIFLLSYKWIVSPTSGCT